MSNERRLIEEMFKNLDEELNLLLYAISHDVRAPLRSIMGFSQAVVEDYSDSLDELGKDYLNRIGKAGKTMDIYIRALLKMSRKTREEITLQTIDLSRVAGKIAGELQQFYPDRQADFEIAQGVTAVMDPRMAELLMTELLENAWKFTAEKKPARILFARAQEKEEGRQEHETVYFVKDNGVGFDMEQARMRLFGVFQKMHPPEQYEGLGTGLATCRRIIHRHGGKIWAESNPMEGTTVFFALPTRGLGFLKEPESSEEM